MSSVADFRAIGESETIRRTPPIHLEDVAPLIFEAEATTYRNSPAAGVQRVAGGYVNRQGAARDSLGRWIPWNKQALPAGQHEDAHAWNPTVWIKRSFRPHGTVGALTHPRQSGYFHWLFDVLPRFALLESTEQRLDWLYLDQSQTFQQQTWGRLGVNTSVIDASMHENIHAAEMLVPSAPSTSGVVPGWVCHWLRTRLRVQSRGPRQNLRLYVSRAISGKGMIANEDSVRACVEKRGFTTIYSEQLSMDEQISLFAQAEVVLGPHGAGLSNVLFANQGCTVVELFAQNYINVCYWTLCCQLDLTYAFMVATATDGLGGAARSDLFVDVNKLNRLLDSLGVLNVNNDGGAS